MWLFKSTYETNGIQSHALNLRHRARKAALFVTMAVVAAVTFASLPTTLLAQQSSGKSGQFRKRSATPSDSTSTLDPKLRGFLEKQVGIEHAQPRTARTPNRSESSTVEPRRSSASSATKVHPASEATNIETETTSLFPHADRSIERSSLAVRETASSVIRQAAWEPEPNAEPEPVVSHPAETEPSSSLSPLKDADRLSELQPTPSTAQPSAPMEISVPLKSAEDARPFLDLRGEEEPAATPSVAGERGPEVAILSSPGQVLSRAVAWIVIALCLFCLAALGVRRWQRQRGLLPGPGSRSRIVETLSLGPGRSVSLIEMAGHRALVAFDAGGIKQLVLTPPSFQDELTEAEDPLIYERPARTRADSAVLASETQT